MPQVFEFFQHLDQHLVEAVQQYGTLVYGVLAAVIFCETGLIITAFLPGDSLLFAAASLAAARVMHPGLVFTLLPLACFLGDQANYFLGKTFGRRLFRGQKPFFNEQNLRKAEAFYGRHGARAIIFGRFVPVVRSLAPFVAAATGLPYGRFVRYSLLGAAAWSYLFLLLGYFFGQLPFVKDRLWVVITGVVALSFVPLLVQYLRNKGRKTPA